MDDARRQGSVKWFSRVKGYGFIAPDDQEKEIFVHFSGIEAEGYRNLEQGQRVTFEVEDTPKGPQAIHVTIVASESEVASDSEAGTESVAGTDSEAAA
jgi:CspA family cold shock protein